MHHPLDVVVEVGADARGVDERLDPELPQVLAGPIPESISSFGVSIAPAVTITSRRAVDRS